MNSTPNLVVVGLGYIGLPTAALFASKGIDVVGVDTAASVIESLAAGRPHIAEPGLNELVAEVVASGKLRPTAVPEPADVFVIAVPTPFADDRSPDLQFVEAAIDSVAPHLAPGNLVVIESTCPVGTTEAMASRLGELRPDLAVPADIAMAYCPERVLPGNILHELRNNDRIVGGLTTDCASAASALYRQVVDGACHETTARIAELAKLSENAYRDVNIAFANELSLISHKLDVDVWELIQLANLHPRVNVLQPGAGVGGHCIAVDPWFIVHSAPEESSLIRASRRVNDAKPAWVVERILEQVSLVAEQTPNEPVTVAGFGLTYKPDSDDLRGSPAIEVVRQLATHDVSVVAVEPNLTELPASLADAGVRLVSSDDALAMADVVVGLVAHTAFRTLSPAESSMVVDAAGIWL